MKEVKVEDLTCLTSNEKLKLEVMLRQVKNSFKVREFILFGSRARGDFGEDSDVDVIALTDLPSTREVRHSLSDLLFDLNPCYEPPLSVMHYNLKDWELGKVAPTFKMNVMKDGVKLEL